MPSWVGDVVMATPFLNAVRGRFADSHITLLMKRHLHDLVRGGPWMDRCVFWPSKRPRSVARREAGQLIRGLREEKIDLAILLPNSFHAAWLAWRVGAKRRIGYRRDGRGWLLTDRLAVPNRNRRGYEPMPLVDYYAHIAEALGCERPGDQLTLYTDADSERTAQARLAALGIDESRPIVAICPGAKFGASKCWHTERFAAVADHLVQRYGVAVAISPGPGEEPLARDIAQKMRRPAALLTDPCLTLGELKALIRRSVLLLGNDTGPRHFARAFDVPRVTVFGPTEPRWTDTSHGQERIVRVDVDCGPCHKKVCPLGHLKCMDLVTVDMVARACEQLLEEGDASRWIAAANEPGFKSKG